MALLSKKLYIQNSSGTQYIVRIYGTQSEAGSLYIYCNADTTAGFVRIASTSDSYATPGRVTKNGTTYAICKTVAAPAYNYSYYTSSGSFTVPANVYKLRITCVGGGAGGVTGGVIGETIPNTGTTSFGVQGGTTSFGSLCSAAGGTQPSITTSGGSVVSYIVSQGFYNGGYYPGSTDLHMVSAVPVPNVNGTSVGTCGQGGYCDENNGGRHNFSGASGARVTKIVDVTPGTVFTITIGGGGQWWGRGGLQTAEHNNHGYGGCSGKSGGCLVEWGTGIQE